MSVDLTGFRFSAATTHAAVQGQQFTLFYVKRAGFFHLPFMKTVLAQRSSLELVLEFRLFEGYNITHGGALFYLGVAVQC
jgi:hypothetical protein